jgi:MFS transporter, MHS family, proline/betaine transporter
LKLKKVILAGMIGNGLEWFDYALYGLLSSIISEHYFPADNKLTQLIATYGVFAAGFAMRPLGAFLFGYIGDKYGRKASLSLSILLMALPTACIGLLPTYAQIGIMAPILLTVIRLFQGLALGGEFSGSITYVVEHSPPDKRGLVGSTTLISMMMGILLGSAITSLLTNIMDIESFKSWGWRIPFILGLGIGLVGFYIRSFLDESPVFIKAKSSQYSTKTPIRSYLKPFLIVTGLYIATTIPFYLISVMMNSYLHNVLKYPLSDAMLINTIVMLLILMLIPCGAILSDKVGRKPVMKFMLLAYAIVTLPAFWLIGTGNFWCALIGQIALATVLAMYMSPIPAILVEVFPTNIRYTAMALSCNIAAAIFGGTSPMIVTWLIQYTHNNMIIAWYILASVAISTISLVYYRETYKVAL